MKSIIDTNSIKAGYHGPWLAERLAACNGVNLKFRVMRGTTAEFHTHEQSPECFFVLSGCVHIDTEFGTATLNPGQFFEVAPGVRHRSRVEGEATVLVFDSIDS